MQWVRYALVFKILTFLCSGIWMYGLRSLYQTVIIFSAFYFLAQANKMYRKLCEIDWIGLPICTVATAVTAVCQYCGTVTVCDSNPHCHYISAHCYQYVR